jgi:hypothetical protein
VALVAVPGDRAAAGGGTTTGPGSGGAGAGGAYGTAGSSGSAGSFLTGGQGGASNSNSNASGGGGGGGYYGGGGGGACFGGGGGGGGSSFVAHDASAVGGSSASSAAAMVSIAYFASSTTALATSKTTATPGTAVTFTASVTGAGPTGTVAFEADGETISGCGAQVLAVGTSTATCTTSSLAAGFESITASYSGDSANSASESAPLTQAVVGPPTATILAPAAGGRYTLGQSVQTIFFCSEAAYGPGVASCDDSTHTDTLSGGLGQLDTSSLGRHTYEVTATSKDGQSGTASITYTVVASPPPTVAIKTKRGLVTGRRTQIRLACAGGRSGSACDGVLTLSVRRRIVRIVDHRRKASFRTIVLARARFALRQSSSRPVALRLTAAGLRLLARAPHHRLRVSARAALRRGKAADRRILLQRAGRR